MHAAFVRPIPLKAMLSFCFAVLLMTGCDYLGIPPDGNAPDDPSTPLFTFGVIADAQYCDCDPRGMRYYRNSTEKLPAAVDALNAEDLAFTIHLGDFIDRDFESYARMLPLYQRLNMPAYHVLGNHEFAVDSTRIDDVPGVLGLEKRYYDFSQGNWRFIVLDGNDLSLYATHAGTEKRAQAEAMYDRLVQSGAPNAQPWNGGLGEEQMAWLERTLEEAADTGEQVVLFAHFPVFPKNEHNLWNDDEVIRLIASYDNVVAYMNGHNHAGNYGEQDGIHYVTVDGMVETPEENAYGTVEVYADRLVLNGVGRVPDRSLEFEPYAAKTSGR